MKRKHYKDKEPWEKFLDNERVRQNRRNKKIRENEILIDSEIMPYLLNKNRLDQSKQERNKKYE